MEKIKIIIVDDHILFSQALRGLIDYCEQCKKNEKENIKPDIILMDVQMPVVNGIEATQRITDNHPDIKVLGLTMNDNEETILKMLRAGAKGYLLKDIHPSVLKMAIIQTYERGFFYTEQVSETLLHASKIDSKELKTVDLKPRELELLKYAAKEMTYKEIAEKMFLSPKTIDNYREKLFYKLDVKSRVGLVLYAIKEGLADDE